MVDDVAVYAASLNADARSAELNRAALAAAILTKGPAFQEAISVGHDHLFADVLLFVSSAQLRQMRDVIAAVERVVKLPGWGNNATNNDPYSSLGVFYGYDFHLNEQGAHLIEINSNAGGAFLNAMLIESQRDVAMHGSAPVRGECLPFVSLDTPRNARHSGRTENVSNHLEQTFLAMFRNEWRLVRGDAPLKTIAIVDEQPDGQYLYPEFLLAKKLFESAGVAVRIVDPSALQARADGLYFEELKIDLVYNRLTDFSLQQYAALRQACLDGCVVLTPSPAHYARYADKRNLARLGDADGLRTLGAKDADIAILQTGVPHTIVVGPEMEEALWAERKQWFFKPNSGYGSKGAYRGEKLTKRVFAEILQSDYVAQKMAIPGERSVCVNNAEAVSLKYDVRCYVYDGQVQLVAARLYQGQTTNFRTPGGGFAVVRVVE